MAYGNDVPLVLKILEENVDVSRRLRVRSDVGQYIDCRFR